METQIEEQIKAYALANNITLVGKCYEAFSMIKEKSQYFPLKKMFKSINCLGKYNDKYIVIVTADTNIETIQSQNILEKLISPNREDFFRIHRHTAHF